jgi:hypothetical protein
MKHVKLFEDFGSSASLELTEEQMGWLHKCTNGSWIFNQSTRSVDINGDFSCGGQGLTHFKGVIFGEVDGDFDCDNNNLSSLEGAPRYVDGGFYCGKNKLTSPGRSARGGWPRF